MHLFYHPAYLRIQSHQGLHHFEQEDVEVFFKVEGGQAVSLPNGLFGSFQYTQEPGFWWFKRYFREVVADLKKLKVSKATIRQPVEIYKDIIRADVLMTEGMRVEYLDINHHLDLKTYEHKSLHQMEQRRLSKSSFWVHQTDEWEKVYDFLRESREEAGLKPNISKAKLLALVNAFPNRYLAFVAQSGDKWAAVVVFVEASEGVAYYYLPATAKAYKSESPMVQLLFESAQFYKDQGFAYMDLGVSSLKGKRQEGLITFKERMGGISAQKPTLSMEL